MNSGTRAVTFLSKCPSPNPSARQNILLLWLCSNGVGGGLAKTPPTVKHAANTWKPSKNLTYKQCFKTSAQEDIEGATLH